MNEKEILNYIDMSRNKSICIDRCLLEKYPGYVREITIMKDKILKVEFNVYGYDEGGLIIKVYYEDYNKLFNAVQEFINIGIQEWENFSKSDWYPNLEDEVDFDYSGLMLKQDLINKTLSIPKDGARYEIPLGYWKDVSEGKIS